MIKTYKGKITALLPNQIFVFGSNTEGRHGKGAALYAKEHFGAVQGMSQGRQGMSYAIVTKDLNATTQPSKSKYHIINEICGLYTYAENHPLLEFLIAYSAGTRNLCGYSSEVLASFFSYYTIPPNIVFEEGFAKLLKAPKPVGGTNGGD
jgi:hypothetical protein